MAPTREHHEDSKVYNNNNLESFYVPSETIGNIFIVLDIIKPNSSPYYIQKTDEIQELLAAPIGCYDRKRNLPVSNLS